MTHIAIIGAGIGGVPCAYELRKRLAKQHRVTLIGSSRYFEFTPSNPWVAVGWRRPEQTRVELRRPLESKGIEWLDDVVGEHRCAHARAHPAHRCEAGLRLPGDHDRSKARIRGGAGPRAEWSSRSRSARRRTPLQAWEQYQNFVQNPGPIVIGAAAGASCFGPAYEFAMILDADLRKRKIRDRVPMTYVTSEPYIGHMGLGGVGDSKGLMEIGAASAAHQVDHERQDHCRC